MEQNQQPGARTLETGRLLLRPLRMEDAETMYETWCTDPEVCRYLTWVPYTSIEPFRERLAKWVEEYDDPACYRFGIVRKEDGRLMGQIDVVGLHHGNPVIGYLLGREFWNQGYMTEALHAVCEKLFADGWEQVVIEAVAENAGSNRVIQKNGFTRVVTYSQPMSKAKPEIVTLNSYRLYRPQDRRVASGAVTPMLETKYLSVAGVISREDRHYYIATRRPLSDLTAARTEEEFKNMLPDAVSCFVIVKTPDCEPRLLLSYEFRYPVGQYLLSPPAGLIDPADTLKEDPLLTTARREIFEETGITVGPGDPLFVVNPGVFSTPGMTDENNALVCAVVSLPDLSCLTQSGAEGAEKFDGFYPVTRAQAKELLKTGRDPHGFYYPLYTWAALMYFVSGLWEEEAADRS